MSSSEQSVWSDALIAIRPLQRCTSFRRQLLHGLSTSRILFPTLKYVSQIKQIYIFSIYASFCGDMLRKVKPPKSHLVYFRVLIFIYCTKYLCKISRFGKIVNMIRMGLFKSIFRLRIRPTLSLAPVRPFFFSTARSSALPEATNNSATPKKKLSHQAQSAIWAERVIQYILTARPLTDIHSYSLREQIVKLQNPDNVHHFEPEPKEKVMQLFTQGVLLNDFVFDQNRIQQAKQEFQQGYNEENNFIFCPNLLVTKEIFGYMMELASNYLVTGGFGISKTVFMVLFIQLSNQLNSYLFKAAQPRHKDTMEELHYLKSVQPNPFFFDQNNIYEKLEHSNIKLYQQKPYFSTKIPRCWYWSISSEATQIQQQFRQLLLQQASQLSKQKRKELRSIKEFSQFILELKKCYPDFQSYCMKVVVDQINSAVSRARTWNMYVDQCKKNKNQKPHNKMYENYFKLRAQMNFKYVKSAIQLSNFPKPSYVLNSSMSIQRDLLERKDDQQPQKVYFDIQKDLGKFQIKEIPYLQGLNESFIDFLHKFWFQIERKFKILNKDDVLIDEMKKKFFEEVKDKKVNYFSRFLFVREYLTQKKIQQIQKKYEQFKKGEKQYNPFKGMYESFIEENKVKYKKNLQNYFLKDKSDPTLTLLYTIYDIAALQGYNSDKDKHLTADLKDLEHRLGQDPLNLLKLDIYKEILPFTFAQDKKSIKFYWKPEQFTSTTRDILFIRMGDYIYPKIDNGFQWHQNVVDFNWKKSVIQSMKKGADVTFRQPKLKQLQELRFTIKQNRLTTFQSFNEYIITPKSKIELDNRFNQQNMLERQQALAYIKKVYGGNPSDEMYPGLLEIYNVHKVATASIIKNLKDLFDKCDQHPGDYCIATPCERSEYEFIDIIIAKKQLNKYYMFTFDISLFSKKQRVQDAKALFDDLLSRQPGEQNYIINHVALCSRDAEQSLPYNIYKNFNIFYSPWDEITFRNSNNEEEFKKFCRIREINFYSNKMWEGEEEKEKEKEE